jgi:lipopolysaccharide export system permease protein
MKFPGIKILDRYIIRKFIGTFVFAIALLIVVIVIFDTVEKLDGFIEKKAPLTAVLFQYFANFIPFFINQFSGLFVFIAVIFFTSKLAYQTEIVAMLSGGMSFLRLMWPYFISAFVIMVVTLLLNLFVIPVANTKRIDFENKYVARSTKFIVDQNLFRQLSPGTFVYIRNFNANTNEAQHLSIEKYEGSRIVEVLEAGTRVKFDRESMRWSAERYIIRTFDENDVENFQTHTKLDTALNISYEEMGGLIDLARTMNIVDLNKLIRQQREKGSDMLPVLEVERTQRFSYPFSILILTLIGVSLSSRKVRGGTGLHLGVGIGLCFSYILIAKFVEEFAKGGVMPPVIAVWIPNMLFAAIALYLYKKAPK